jgi:hypothetical protein
VPPAVLIHLLHVYLKNSQEAECQA